MPKQQLAFVPGLVSQVFAYSKPRGSPHKNLQKTCLLHPFAECTRASRSKALFCDSRVGKLAFGTHEREKIQNQVGEPGGARKVQGKAKRDQLEAKMSQDGAKVIHNGGQGVFS